MADDRHRDQPSDPPPSVQALGATEEQLDAVLTHAADSVDELQIGVGIPASPVDNVERILDRRGPVSLPEVIDSQLDEIDQLLAETGKQLGSGETRTSLQSSKRSENLQSTQSPGYMSDLMDSEGVARSSTPAVPLAVSKESAAPVPDFMSEFTQDDVTPPPRPAPVAKPADVRESTAAPVPKPPGTAAHSPNFRNTSDDQNTPPLPEATVRRSTSSRPLFSVADFAVSMLEIIDRPFRRFSSRTREVLGWLAIIALATSALIGALSFF